MGLITAFIPVSGPLPQEQHLSAPPASPAPRRCHINHNTKQRLREKRWTFENWRAAIVMERQRRFYRTRALSLGRRESRRPPQGRRSPQCLMEDGKGIMKHALRRELHWRLTVQPP